MTPARQHQIPALEAFYQAHIATSMFPLSNLRRFGLAGGHPRACRFWLCQDAGAVTGAVALSEEGFLFPQCPQGGWDSLRDPLKGERIKGILGDGDQAQALRDALSLPRPAEMDDVDPLYTLALEDLRLPDVAGYDLSPITPDVREEVIRWRAAYLREVMPVPGEDLNQRAATEIENYITADSHRVLLKHGVAVSMTGFNAQLAEAVQVGGVYTPEAKRGQGFARRAVALHLVEARDKGIAAAILFAASERAGRVYEAIGFRREGAFALIMYETPQVVHG